LSVFVINLAEVEEFPSCCGPYAPLNGCSCRAEGKPALAPAPLLSGGLWGAEQAALSLSTAGEAHQGEAGRAGKHMW